MIRGNLLYIPLVWTKWEVLVSTNWYATSQRRYQKRSLYRFWPCNENVQLGFSERNPHKWPQNQKLDQTSKVQMSTKLENNGKELPSNLTQFHPKSRRGREILQGVFCLKGDSFNLHKRLFFFAESLWNFAKT